MDFDWDDANVEHIAWHDIEPHEAEEIFYNLPQLEFAPSEVGDELRQSVIGRTDRNRVLKVAYTRRGDRIRVVTAHTPNLADMAAYRRRLLK